MSDTNSAIRQVDGLLEQQLDNLSQTIEEKLDADVFAIVGSIYGGLDGATRAALEKRNANREEPRQQAAIILHTPGGIIEIVERIVNAIRHFYEEVTVIVPDMAMSAGTVLALSADRIMMDYFSCLGPIDPQIQRDSKLVPALSYLVQYERLIKKAADNALTTPEMVMLQQLDLAELHKFEEAKELSVSLLKEWLAKYKFKDWIQTETRGLDVTEEMREERALKIAESLMNHQSWHSHGRPINMHTLKEELGLKIDDFGDDPALSEAIHDYHKFLTDYMHKLGIHTIVHTQQQCLK